MRAPVGIGTAINVVAVLAGGGSGTLVGAKLPGAMRHTTMQAIGIVTLLVGVSNFRVFDITSAQMVPTLKLVGVRGDTVRKKERWGSVQWITEAPLQNLGTLK
jgi:uncharacterized membrane protein YqgA involved in biofilm formation